jgi:ribosome-associated translation inhibitor RaiA
MLTLPAHQDINITEETHDLFEAIDLVEKRLVRNLTEQRQRQINEKRQAKEERRGGEDEILS